MDSVRLDIIYRQSSLSLHFSSDLVMTCGDIDSTCSSASEEVYVRGSVVATTRREVGQNNKTSFRYFVSAQQSQHIVRLS